ncbi:uncharacterized protein TrAtP1_009902 [Trichoderma atroviride]|uniref:uncharacterized protein n=1 Tax=Hypocrea atroviridis TaxID=63577 RepID=UPI0033263299|nr:hypothetical protein TrAtP1_009902 [Trichoderma atroviride]
MDSLAVAAGAVPSQRSSTRSRLYAGSRASDPDGPQQWTAARCQRLLRQLQSRLTSLRKLVSEKPSAPLAGSKRPSDNGQDPTSKRVRSTYGQRNKRVAPSVPDKSVTTPPRAVRTLGAMKLGNVSPTSESVDFLTPVWRKIRDQVDTPMKNIDIEHDLLNSLPSDMIEELNAIRRHVPSEPYRIYEAIFHWLHRLLHSTTPQGQHPRGKSLLAMCLRRIPDCIANIDAYDRQQLKDSGEESIWNISDAASDLFDQIENLGADRSGWRPLRLVVRSQAIHLLSNAIVDGLFRPEFFNLLVRLCVHLKGNGEASKLFASIYKRQVSLLQAMPSRFGESKDLSSLFALLNSLKGKRISGLIFECVSALVNRGRLSASALSSRAFSGFWISSLEGLTSGNAKPQIVEFTCSAIWTLARGHRPKTAECNAIEQALIRVAAGLAVAALTLESQIIPGEQEQRLSAWRRLAYVLDRSISLIARYKSRTSPQDNASFLLVLARYIAVANSELANVAFKRRAAEDFENMAHKIDTEANNGKQYQQTIILLCTIIQCRRRSDSASSQEILADLYLKLNHEKLPDWFGRGLRKDVAFMLAQKTEDLRDLNFAESLSMTTPADPKFSTIFSGWRWEEGISEWVLPTSPQRTMAAGRAAMPAKATNLSDVENEPYLEDSEEERRLEGPRRRDSRRVVSYRRRRQTDSALLEKNKISNFQSIRWKTSNDGDGCETAFGCMDIKTPIRRPKAVKPFYVLSQLHRDLRDEIDEVDELV